MAASGVSYYGRESNARYGESLMAQSRNATSNQFINKLILFNAEIWMVRRL